MFDKGYETANCIYLVLPEFRMPKKQNYVLHWETSKHFHRKTKGKAGILLKIDI